MNLASFRANPCYLVITPHQVRSGVRFRLNTLGLCSSSTVDTLLASAAFGLGGAADSSGAGSGGGGSGGGSGGSGGSSSRSRIAEVSVFLPAAEASRHGPTYLLWLYSLWLCSLWLCVLWLTYFRAGTPSGGRRHPRYLVITPRQVRGAPAAVRGARLRGRVQLRAALRPGLDPCYLVITPHPCAFVRRSAQAGVSE